MAHGLMKPAAWMMYGSAALHLVAPVVAGFSPGSLALLPFAVIWAVIAWLLINRGWRWLAWGAFFLALFGVIASLVGPGDVPVWLMRGITLFDALAAACLFVVLWRSKPEQAVG